MHISAEHYLEAILVLSRGSDCVRAVDVAAALGYSKPSVSVALKQLREKEHITVEKNGAIVLTDSGRMLAERIAERHEFLTAWLIGLGVAADIADEDACKIEHVISDESFAAIKQSATLSSEDI